MQDHVRPWQTGKPPPAAPARSLTAPEISRLLLRDPDDLDADDQTRPAAVRAACPDLDRLAEHVTRFAVMVTGLRGDRLGAWLTLVETDDQPELCSFAAGIRRDYDAVRNGRPQPMNGRMVREPSLPTIVQGASRWRSLSGG